ncbi:MAG: hypothetical protein WC054_13475 [Candidatus Nanopelagicales bacterium]
MNRMKKSVAVSASTIAVVALVAGCGASAQGSGAEPASSTETSSAPTRNADRVTDCGGSDRGTGGSVSIANRTNAALFFSAVEVDCYDWYNTKNPTQFNGTFASPGTDLGPYNMLMRDIPEWGGQIRPWNFQVSGRADQGPSLTGELVSRPTYKFAKGNCYTANGGMTACSGSSLCTDDPNLKKVETTVRMRNKAGELVTTLNVSTVCTLTDKSAVIVFKGTLPTS